MTSKTTKLMKDELNEASIRTIACRIAMVYSDFPIEDFVVIATNNLERMALKERVNHVITALSVFLPKSFDEAADILKQLPEYNKQDTDIDVLSGFTAWPIIDYVAVHGLEHPKLAMSVLENLTPLFSAEFAIRPFVERHFLLILPILVNWTSHSNEHVRRLVSEGIRPRLPWGRQLSMFIENPEPIFSLLEKLRYDDSEYVRRSVANNLNDISKDHPKDVVLLCEDWLNSTETKDQEYKIKRIVAHATRGLVKAGYPPVFNLLGYTENPSVNIDSLSIKKDNIRIGESIQFDIQLTAKNDACRFVLDYAIYFVKSSGKTKPKIFKLKNCSLNKGQTLHLSKTHSFEPITTRRYYPGQHCLTLCINGVLIKNTEQLFEVSV